MFLNTLILLSAIILLYVHWFYKKRFSYFEKRNIAHLKPTLFLGNIKDAFFHKKALIEVYNDIYCKLKPYKICGYFNFHRPVFLICDPELIKNIFVKDFAHFSDRHSSARTKSEPITRNLATLNGKPWKNLRGKLTPTFTSGKIKMMFPLMKVCGNNLNNFLNKLTSEEDIEFNDLCGRFTTDIIATCALGLETNSFENPESELLKFNKEAVSNRFLLFIHRFTRNMPKKIAKIIESRFLNQKTKKFYYSMTLDLIKYRESNNIIRNDFLHLLIEMKKNSVANNFPDDQDEKGANKFQTKIGDEDGDDKYDLEITNDLLVAQVFLFTLAGYKTTLIALSFALLELALNPDIQDKVRKEITAILKNNNDEFTYEAMKQMKYTDMVIFEALRKHPPLGSLPRACTRTYIIPGTDIVINKDDAISIPTHSLHNDKQYYDKPDEFYPEHFTQEAIAKRPNYTYLPFGEGPRMCIASRFALMNLKVGLVYTLKNFSYCVSPKMKLPMKYRTGFNNETTLEGEIWLKCNKI